MDRRRIGIMAVLLASLLVFAAVYFFFVWSGAPMTLPRSTAQLLRNATSVELLSLQPTELAGSEVEAWRGRRFHGYPVVRSVVLKSGEEKSAALTAFVRGVVANYGDAAACFRPRHGLIVGDGLRRAHFVICYECWQMRVYETPLPVRVFTSRDPEGHLNVLLNRR